MNNDLPQNSGSSIELNLREVDEDNKNPKFQNKTTLVIVLIFVFLVAVVLIASTIQNTLNKPVSFKSSDEKVNVTASVKWALGKIINEKPDEDTFTVPSLSIYKSDNPMCPSQVNISYIYTDISGKSLSEVYSLWKETYEYNDTFRLNGNFQLDSEGDTLPIEPNFIDVAGYRAAQVKFDLKSITNMEMIQLTTIIPTETSCFIIDGFALRPKEEDFNREYDKILQSIKFQ